MKQNVLTTVIQSQRKQKRRHFEAAVEDPVNTTNMSSKNEPYNASETGVGIHS